MQHAGVVLERGRRYALEVESRNDFADADDECLSFVLSVEVACTAALPLPEPCVGSVPDFSGMGEGAASWNSTQPLVYAASRVPTVFPFVLNVRTAAASVLAFVERDFVLVGMTVDLLADVEDRTVRVGDSLAQGERVGPLVLPRGLYVLRVADDGLLPQQNDSCVRASVIVSVTEVRNPGSGSRSVVSQCPSMPFPESLAAQPFISPPMNFEAAFAGEYRLPVVEVRARALARCARRSAALSHADVHAQHGWSALVMPSFEVPRRTLLLLTAVASTPVDLRVWSRDPSGSVRGTCVHRPTGIADGEYRRPRW